MPEVDTPAIPAPAKLRRFASLDSLRGLAVLAVIAYHYDLAWARGFFLSVDLFFALSGYLITKLLILEWQRSDRIGLGAFWARRARRLLPALFIVLALVAIVSVHTIDPWRRAGVRDDGLASLFYVANWRFIAAKQGYFELFAAPSPLLHMWTLAIEEQFYLVWPLLTFGLLRAARGSLRLLGVVCVVGVAASAVTMAKLYNSADPSRAYYGTDARAQTILVGALLAIALASWKVGAVAQRRIRIAGLLAFVMMLVTWATATPTSPRYYYGGALAYAVLVCIVIAGAQQPGVLQRTLSFRPLAWVGLISYGLYLFHWPLIVWLVPSRVHVHGLALNLLRLTLTFAFATVSYYLIELPIRERRRPSLPWRRASVDAAQRTRAPRNVARWLAIPGLAVTFAIVLTTTTGASPAPNYLAGSRRPPSASFAPTFSAAKYPVPPTSTTLPSGASTSGSGPAPSTTAPAIAYTPPPHTNYPWSYGDPLFCGTPRSDETHEAVDEAHKLGLPDYASYAGGLRILVVGDSTACSFYPGLKAVGDEVHATVAQASVFGCGVASGEITTTRNEQITPNSDRCPAMVNEAVEPAIAGLRPDIVVWMSIWEKSDLLENGETLVSGTAAGDDEMLRRMDFELARLTAYGAKVVVLTEAAPAPNDAQGTDNTSNAIDNASYTRLNKILARFATRNADSVTLVDLAQQVCPTGPPCPEHIDGLRLRPDGRHFTPKAAAIEAHWLIPRIVPVARHG